MKASRKILTNRARVSTMPRNKSESSTQLELYKKVIEKQRIHREMHLITDQIVLLQKRLDALSNQMHETEKTINQLRQSDSSFTQSTSPPNILSSSNNYQNFEIEYYS